MKIELAYYSRMLVGDDAEIDFKLANLKRLQEVRVIDIPTGATMFEAAQVALKEKYGVPTKDLTLKGIYGNGVYCQLVYDIPSAFVKSDIAQILKEQAQVLKRKRDVEGKRDLLIQCTNGVWHRMGDTSEIVECSADGQFAIVSGLQSLGANLWKAKGKVKVVSL